MCEQKVLLDKSSNEHNFIISNVSHKSTETSVREEDKSTSDNQRFSLRKRKSINYNVKTKKFEYEEDSDYEESPKKKIKKK